MVGSLLDPQLRRLIGQFFKLLVPTGPERLWSTDSANLPPAADKKHLVDKAEAGREIDVFVANRHRGRGALLVEPEALWRVVVNRLLNAQRKAVGQIIGQIVPVKLGLNPRFKVG